MKYNPDEITDKMEEGAKGLIQGGMSLLGAARTLKANKNDIKPKDEEYFYGTALRGIEHVKIFLDSTPADPPDYSDFVPATFKRS